MKSSGEELWVLLLEMVGGGCDGGLPWRNFNEACGGERTGEVSGVLRLNEGNFAIRLKGSR